MPMPETAMHKYSGVILRDATMGLTGLLAGPLFSMSANAARSIELDLRPTIGAARGQATVGNESGTDDKFIFVFGVGGSARFNLSNNFSLSGNLDYIHGKMEEYGFSLSSVGISVGANYRF
ncbi:hypothetical protein FACS189435_3900 [Bacteroidia bacterium]|nr:hypothetical protein FACS189435_3900 [Bacteroidia bacterium]